MPGTRCAVAICNNSLVETKRKNLDITYHTFPKHQQIFEEWVKACCRTDKWNPKTSVVCSEHFKNDDFSTDLKAKLLNIKVKRKLKPSAIPSLFCTPPKCERGEVHKRSRKKCGRKKNQKKGAVEVSVAHSKSVIEPDPLIVKNIDEMDLSSEHRIQELINENEALKIDQKVLQDSFEKQKTELENTQKLLANVAAKLEDETHRRHQLEETLSKVLNKSQNVVVVVKKKGD